ncbi:PREDICTED: uncharacterized protein LOC100637172, partial [Amphimedon queenslandica]|uniref:Integrase catalytic domain-containing protein n=2 Tax=Amphimedon queenslandica TaxID=400682 RepID=A0AAN0INI0_AMPQE
KSKTLFKEGGFNLRKFVTNSESLRVKIKEHQKSSTSTNEQDMSDTDTTLRKDQSDTEREREHKVLGVLWDPMRDEIIVGFGEIALEAHSVNPTKRSIVSIVGKFYDPLGILSPVIIRFKILFQELCREKRDWDEPITGPLLTRWHMLINDLKASESVRIKRCVSEQQGMCELIGFCDASMAAYAAVVYLKDGNGVVRVIAAKTRVAPLKTQSVPRLELLAALLLSRLIENVLESVSMVLAISRVTCYTDSQIVWHWIRGEDKSWKPFVQKRVKEIRQHTSIQSWKHCAGASNPADIPSRGIAIMELSESNVWWNGPEWLGAEATDETEVPMPKKCMEELRVKDCETSHGLTANSEQRGLIKIISIERFSSIKKLLRVTAYVFRFINRLRGAECGNIITASEMNDAEMLWIKEIQESSPEMRKWKEQYGAFKDQQGIWRCGGRIDNAEVTFEVKHPILLPNRHYFTKLVVKRAHERLMHSGVKETLTELRSKYWVPRGRSLVRLFIHYCVLCRKFRALPYKAPLPPPLPDFRVKECQPFMFTGVDYAGPLHLREGKSTQKVWICLFTCAVIRAVHLDVVPNLSSKSFVRCFKRFSARRGLPEKIISDNGTTFKGASKTVQRIMKEQEVREYLTDKGIAWTFNIEKAPWWGGFFERMIQMMKRCVRKIIGRAVLTYEELLTVIAEVELIINSRPLTYLTASDTEEPLTPSHLLTGRRIMSLPDHLSYHSDESYELNPDPILLNKHMKFLNTTVNRFWSRWKKEYLLELREIHKNTRARKITPISEGDIVIVHSEDLPRAFWRLGKIEKLFSGRDGNIRGASVRVHGRDGSTLLRRPIQLLYPLEIVHRSNSQSTEILPSPSPTQPEHAELGETRPQRSGARDARARIVAQTLND